MTIAAIVLDFGNVVGFFDHNKATKRLSAMARMPHDRLHELLHEGLLASDFEVGRVTAEAFRTQVCTQAELNCAGDFFDDAYGDIFWPNPAVCELVPALAQRYPLYLLSNTNALHARRFLEQFASTLGHFRSLMLSHLIGLCKPQAEIFAHAAMETGRSPGELIFVDDMEANIAAARQQGWNGIVYDGGDLRGRLASHGIAI